MAAASKQRAAPTGRHPDSAMPSRVAEILLEQGRQAARAREAQGQIWGGTVARLGQLPTQMIQQQQEEAERAGLAEDRALRRQAMNERLRGEAETRRLQTLTSEVVRKHTKRDEASGHMVFDHPAITDELLGVAGPGALEAIKKFGELAKGIETDLNEVQDRKLAFETRKRQGYAAILGRVAEAPESEREARYSMLLDALPEEAKNDPVLGKLPPTYPGHLAIKDLYERQLTDQERYTRAEKAAEARWKRVKELSPGAKLVELAPETGAPTVLAEAPPGDTSLNREALALRAAQGDLEAKQALDLLKTAGGGASPTLATIALEAAGGDAKKALQLMKTHALPPGEKKEKPPTGEQTKTLGYFNRAKQASEDIEPIEQTIASRGLTKQAYDRWMPNFAKTAVGRAYLQSQRAFTEARLRKESGAQIAASEYENDEKTYFAQPGDDATTIGNKQRARQAILGGLAYQAGPALKAFYGDEAEGMIEAYRRQAKKPPPPGQKPPGPEQRIGPYTFVVE